MFLPMDICVITYLPNRPVAFKKGTTKADLELTENPYPTWQKMEEMVAKGKVRNIGISKYVALGPLSSGMGLMYL